MDLEWREAKPSDNEGNQYHYHYLIDTLSDQCLATIQEPRWGSILYVTDLRIRGDDRSFVTLAAAKAHCECSAMQANMEDAVAMTRQFEPTPKPKSQTSAAKESLDEQPSH
jgi:hypothetical protein